METECIIIKITLYKLKKGEENKMTNKVKNKRKLGIGMRYNSNGTIEGYGVIHNERGEALTYSFTRGTVGEVVDIKARIGKLRVVDKDVIKIKINKYTDEIELIRKGGTQTNSGTQLSKDMTVSEYIKYFLFEHRRRGRKGKIIEDSTFAGYFDRCKYIADIIGELRVSELTRKNLEYCVDTLQGQGRADSTCKQTRDLLVSMVHFAKKDGLLETDILEGETLTLKEKKGKVKKRIIQKEDRKEFTDYCLQNKDYEILMLYYTGVRPSEMTGITWEDIDFEHCIVDINKEYKRIKKVQIVNGEIKISYEIKFKDLKNTSSERQIGLSTGYVELLKQHKEEQKKLAKENNKEFKETDWVFTTKTYNAYLSDYTGDKMRNIMKTLQVKGYDKITPHCLRHTYCSNAIEKNVGVKQVQKIVGHSNISTTMDIYTQLSNEEIIETSKSIAENM